MPLASWAPWRKCTVSRGATPRSATRVEGRKVGTPQDAHVYERSGECWSDAAAEVQCSMHCTAVPCNVNHFAYGKTYTEIGIPRGVVFRLHATHGQAMQGRGGTGGYTPPFTRGQLDRAARVAAPPTQARHTHLILMHATLSKSERRAPGGGSARHKSKSRMRGSQVKGQVQIWRI